MDADMIGVSRQVCDGKRRVSIEVLRLDEAFWVAVSGCVTVNNTIGSCAPNRFQLMEDTALI